MRCWEIILQHYWKGWRKQFEAAHLSYSDRDKQAQQYLDHPDSLSCRLGITLDFAADFVLSVNQVQWLILCRSIYEQDKSNSRPIIPFNPYSLA